MSHVKMKYTARTVQHKGTFSYSTSIVDRDREKSASVKTFRVTYSICVGMIEQYKLKVEFPYVW